jgi:Protein of unknown function (DUF3223)
MAAKPITIGSSHFAKTGDAISFYKAMLNRYDVGDKVGAADDDLLRAALALHPKTAEKIGCGVTHFSVRSADFGSKCFWVNRTDGTTEKFSYITCIRG